MKVRNVTRCIICKDATSFAGLFVSLVQSFVVPQAQPLFHHLRVQLQPYCLRYLSRIHSFASIIQLALPPSALNRLGQSCVHPRGSRPLLRERPHSHSKSCSVPDFARTCIHCFSQCRCAVISSFVALCRRLRDVQALFIVYRLCAGCTR